MALILGIDIGKRSVRGALLKTSLRSHETERYVEVPIHRITEEGESQASVRAAVDELLGSLGVSPDGIVAAIDGTHASLRRVKIPAAARKRAADVLPFELEPLLPFPIDEAVLDHQEVREADGELELLAAAVPDGVVRDALESLQEVGIDPKELAVGAAALDGLLSTITPPAAEAWILVNLRDVHTDVCIVRDGAVELARTIDEGTDAAKKSPQALRHSLQQSLVKYRADGGPAPSRMLLMGEGSRDANLVSWLSSLFDVPTEALNLPASKSGGDVSPVFGLAWALAARGTRRGKRLDLRRGPFAVTRGASQLRENALLITACVLAVLLSYGFSAWARHRVLSEERDALAAQLETVTERHFGKGTKSARAARDLLLGGAQPGDPLPRFDAFRALAAISAAVPEGVVHDTRKLEVQLDELGHTGHFQLEGKLPDLTARDQVADALDANECIGELEKGKTSTAPGEDRKSYVLEGQIACPGSTPPGKGKGKQAKRGGR